MTDNRPAGWCLSDLVHALAQLPGGVSLELDGDAGSLGQVRRLCRAYGLDDRVRLAERERTAWRFRGASPAAPGWATDGSPDAAPPETLATIVESLWPQEGGSRATPKDDQVLGGHRVAIVTNLPAHYRIPLFSGLSTRLACAGASLRVFFLGAGAPSRSWLSSKAGLDFDHEFTRSVTLPVRRRRRPFLPLNLRRRLAAFDPTMVLASGFSPFSSVEAALYARRRQIPFGIWSGEIPALAPTGRRSALKTPQREWLARRASFGIAYGSLAARYLFSIAPRLPVVIGRNTSVAEVTRSGGGAGGVLELVAVADLSVPGKGIETVVEALGLLRELPCRLTVIGGWPASGSQLEGSAARDGRVRFLGPLPHDEVLAVHRTSDVFLFPSRVDPFGLALVEAMGSELATIVTPAAGAAADLAVTGHNCLVADADDPETWADRIAVLAGDDHARRSIARQGRQTIERRWTVAHAVEGMTAGLRLGALEAAGAR